MANYYIGDLHFGHFNGMQYDFSNGSRKFDSIEEHDQLIIDNINKVVTPQDNLYFLGDVSWYNPAKTAELLEQIKCKNRYLIKGNHDSWIKDGKCKKLFQGIYDMKRINDNGRSVFLCHFPVMMYPGQHNGTVHIFAHIHNTKEHDDYVEFIQEMDKRIKERDGHRYKPVRAFNVGCMLGYMDYTPRTLDEIMEKANEFRTN